MNKNELEKLIEQVLAEKMSIKLPDMPEKFDDEYGIDDYVADLNKTLGVDNKDFPGSGKKSMADSNQYIELVRKIEKADVFDFEDIKALAGSPTIGLKDVDVSKKLPANRKIALNTSPGNRLLLQVFMTTGWKIMSRDERKRFADLFFHLGNLGRLMNIPAFIKDHSKVYKKLKKQYDKGGGKVYKTPVQRKVVDDPSITGRSLQTALSDKAAMKQDEKTLFDKYFSLVGTKLGLSERLKSLNQFSAGVAGKGFGNLFAGQMSVVEKSQKFIVYTQILDIFNNFAKNIDSGAGAYFFESFLAYLAGGRSGGKEIGLSGGMGEADFIKADGSKGSAKFYQDGSEMKQSWKNFVPGYPVEYIIALKSSEDKVATSDVELLYRFSIKSFTVEAKIVNDRRVVFLNGTQLTDQQMQEAIKDGELILTSAPISGGWKDLGSFIMPQTDKKSLSQFVKEAAKKVDKDVGVAFDNFEKVLKDLKTMRSEITQYSADRSIGHADKAVKSADTFQVNVGKLAGSYGQTLTKENQEPEANESKTPLDQLIEAIIKKNLLK